MQRLAIKRITKSTPHRVYDLSVEGNHNFFIGKSQTLTHNCDYITPQGQAALRNLMETYSLHTRFILTANYVDRIIEPIVSRTQVYELAHPSRADVAKYHVNILTEEEITFEKEDVVTLVQAYHPDIRRIVNTAQMQSKDGVLKLDEKKLIESDFKLKIVSILCDKRKTGLTKWREIRQLIADEGIRDFDATYRALYDRVEEIAGPQTPSAIVLIKEHMYQSSFCVDKEIVFASLVHQLMQLGV